MKKISAFTLIMAILVGVLFTLKQKEPTHIPNHKAQPMGIGDEENPAARFEYEIERLKDLKTGEIPRNVRDKELRFAKKLPQKVAKTAEEEWVQRGPFNAGGRTRAAALDVANEETILIGGVTSGLYKSVDDGASFYLTSNKSDLHSVTAVAQDTRPTKTNTWYYGTGEYYGLISASSTSSRTSGNGIYKSIDGGESWNILASTATNTPQNDIDGTFDIVWRIVTDPTALNEVVLAAVYNGIMYSEDGGESWEPVLGFEEQTPDSDFTDIIVSPTGVFYAALGGDAPLSFSGIYRSTNGIDWTEITPDDWPSFVRRPVLSLNPCNEEEIYVLAEAIGVNNLDHALWKGTLDGNQATWENRSDNLPDGDCQFFYSFEFGKFDSQNSYDIAIAASPDCETLFIGGTNLYRSSDAFETYTYDWIGGYICDEEDPARYVWPNHHPDQHLILFDGENPNKLYSANDGGIYKTENAMADSVIWEDINNGYVASQYYTIAIEPGEVANDIVIGGTQDNGTWLTFSGDVEEDWQYTYIGDGSYCAIPEGKEFVYISWQRGRIFKFQLNEDGTVNAFTRIDHAEPIPGTVFITPFILDPQNGNTMYVSHGQRIWRNTQLDEIELVGNEYDPLPENWSVLPFGNTPSASTVTCFAMSKSNPNYLFYGTLEGRVYVVKNADETGEEAIIQNTLLPPSISNGAYVSSIALDEFNPDQIMVTVSNYNTESIFYTSDFGENWTLVGGNLEDNDPNTETTGPAVLWGAIHNSLEGQVYFAGTSIGLFSTMDIEADSVIWEQEGVEEMGNSIINMIQTRSYDDRVVVATHGNGIYSNGTFYEPWQVGIEAVDLVENLKIGPNPFQNEVRITWNQKEKATVDLKIVNLEGKIVADLFNGELSSGEQTFYWNESAPNGVFLVRIRVGDQQITKKIIKN